MSQLFRMGKPYSPSERILRFNIFQGVRWTKVKPWWKLLKGKPARKLVWRCREKLMYTRGKHPASSPGEWD
jgi:hypothetical protein